jgi:hypothetical protein
MEKAPMSEQIRLTSHDVLKPVTRSSLVPSLKPGFLRLPARAMIKGYSYQTAIFCCRPRSGGASPSSAARPSLDSTKRRGRPIVPAASPLLK